MRRAVHSPAPDLPAHVWSQSDPAAEDFLFMLRRIQGLGEPRHEVRWPTFAETGAEVSDGEIRGVFRQYSVPAPALHALMERDGTAVATAWTVRLLAQAAPAGWGESGSDLCVLGAGPDVRVGGLSVAKANLDSAKSAGSSIRPRMGLGTHFKATGQMSVITYAAQLGHQAFPAEVLDLAMRALINAALAEKAKEN